MHKTLTYSFCLLFTLLTISTIMAADSDSTPISPAREDAAPHLKGAMISLSDYGTQDVAYLSIPEVPPVGGVVMIHEWWGLTNYVKATADTLTKEGFVVVAVDLYNGQVTTDPKQAAELMKELDMESAMKTVSAAVNFLHQSPRFRCDHVGTLGWCMGGGVSLQSALRVKGLDASVIYYGPTETDEKKLSKLHVPLLGIYGTQDQWITPDSVTAFDQLLTKLNKPHEFHSFNAVHAFANPSNANYQADYAAQAWTMSIEFLKREFTQPPPKKGVIDSIFN